MKILIIGPCAPGFLAESYAVALENLGHDISRFDSDKAYLSAAPYAGNRLLRRLFRRRLWDRMNDSTIELARRLKPQLIIAFKGPYLDPATIRLIRSEEGIPFVNYYPDNPYCGVPLDPRKTSAQRHDLIDALREYSRVFTWDRNLVQRLLADRVAASYLAFGADATIFNANNRYECAQCRSGHEVVLVGQHNSKRERHIGTIGRHRVGLWHFSWNRAGAIIKRNHIIHGDSAFGQVCSGIYATAAVSLNVVDDLNMPGHNMRTFEIPASGGVMLSTFTEEQAAFFPEGEAAFYYHKPEELDATIDRLLEDEPLRRSVRQNALRISQDHTYVHRAAELLKSVFE